MLGFWLKLKYVLVWQFPCGTCFKVFVVWEQLSFFRLSRKIWTFRKVNFSLWLLCCQGPAPNCLFIHTVVHGCCSSCRFCTPWLTPGGDLSFLRIQRTAGGESTSQDSYAKKSYSRRSQFFQEIIQWFSHAYGEEALTLWFWEIFCTTPLFLQFIVSWWISIMNSKFICTVELAVFWGEYLVFVLHCYSSFGTAYVSFMHRWLLSQECLVVEAVKWVYLQWFECLIKTCFDSPIWTISKESKTLQWSETNGNGKGGVGNESRARKQLLKRSATTYKYNLKFNIISKLKTLNLSCMLWVGIKNTAF